jgi:hypothetical protein
LNNNRKLRYIENYIPASASDNDEVFPNGIFHFNITRILYNISTLRLKADTELIDVAKWFKTHIRGSDNEEHLPSVDVSKPVLQAEIRPGMFNIIDGKHRMEKAIEIKLNLSSRINLRESSLFHIFWKLEATKPSLNIGMQIVNSSFRVRPPSMLVLIKKSCCSKS